MNTYYNLDCNNEKENKSNDMITDLHLVLLCYVLGSFEQSWGGDMQLK